VVSAFGSTLSEDGGVISAYGSALSEDGGVVSAYGSALSEDGGVVSAYGSALSEDGDVLSVFAHVVSVYRRVTFFNVGFDDGKNCNIYSMLGAQSPIERTFFVHGQDGPPTGLPRSSSSPAPLLVGCRGCRCGAGKVTKRSGACG